MRTSQKIPIMLIPLGIQTLYGSRILKGLGGDVTDYHSLILNFKELESIPLDFTALWSQITDQLPDYDLIDWDKIPHFIGDQINPVLQTGGKPEHISYAAPLESEWITFYHQQIKTSMRADSRRQRKRLQELGDLKFVIASSPEETMRITQLMIQQKQRRYQETEVHNMFTNSHYSDFYVQTAQKLVPIGFIHVSALFCGDQIIATHWGILFQDRFYLLMPTYEGGEWNKYSAGRLLVEYLIEWACLQGIRVFDFTIGAEHYKKDWCKQEMVLYRWTQPVTMKGRGLLRLRQFKNSLKRYPSAFQFLRKLKSKLHL
ncbi:MAG: GNAT family N-acetyltransferase [SAR324 cluster bacterium]|nr:GNAT family N-acetyltransferase [SAR324 cluster bacterium]